MEFDERTHIQVLYTHKLGGNIDALPRLYTLIKGLRRTGIQTVLLDLGDACSSEAWHCAATDGRSMLIVLDGMGYTAANAQDLSFMSREKLEGNLSMALIDLADVHVEEDVICALSPTEGDGHLSVMLMPSNSTELEDGAKLSLAPIDGNSVGEVIIRVNGMAYEIEALTVHAITDATSPDATIAGVVDFVLDEAQYFQKRRNEQITPTHRLVIEHSAELVNREFTGLREIFMQHAEAIDDWTMVKQLVFLFSSAANEIADTLIFSEKGIRILRHNRPLYEAPPLEHNARKMLRLCVWLLKFDDVFKNAFLITDSGSDEITLTFQNLPLTDDEP